MKEKRRDKVKEKREDERENVEIEMNRDQREKMFFCLQKNVSKPSNPPDDLAQNVSTKSLSDELFRKFRI